MQTEKIRIEELVSPSYNPRTITSEEIKKLKDSINEFGYVDPIIVNRVNNHIVGGNQRCLALKELGYTEVDVIFIEEEDLNREKALNIALNKISGEWDNEKLETIFQDLEFDGFDLSFTGFDNVELEDFNLERERANEVDSVIEDDYEVEDEILVTVELGDLYQLGNHRLYCGDATKEESYQILCQDIPMNLVFTDPPYSMGKEKDGVLNDNLNKDNLLKFNKKWIPLTFKRLTDVGSWYCWGIDEPLFDIYSHILKPMQKNNEVTFKNLITWAKHMAQGLSTKDYQKFPMETEKCLFIMKGVQVNSPNIDGYYEGWEGIRKYLADSKKLMGWKDEDIIRITGVTTCARHYFNKSQWQFPTKEHYISLQKEAKKQSKGIEGADAFQKDYDTLKKEYESTRAYFNNTHNDSNKDDIMTDVWRFPPTSITERELVGGHPTPKPIRLCNRAILTSSRENENVLDVFGGSGSTLIACEQLNRNCYMMELDPYYCQVIINRWEAFTGQKAKKLN